MEIELEIEKGSRDHQLDSFLYFYCEGKYYFIIADGFGNSCQEKISASLNRIAELWIEVGDDIFKENNLNRVVDEKISMSFLAASFDSDKISFFSLGDCRIYLNSLLLSNDDSMAWRALIKRKSLKDTAALATIHPLRHTLTKCIGGGRDLFFEHGEHNINSGGKIVLCTDGAWSIFHESIINGKFSTDMIVSNTSDNSLAIVITT